MDHTNKYRKKVNTKAVISSAAQNMYSYLDEWFAKHWCGTMHYTNMLAERILNRYLVRLVLWENWMNTAEAKM